MRALCVGRHRFIAEHFGRYFGQFGLQTEWAAGVRDAVRIARLQQPQLVICDYELLATHSLALWERDALLSRTPVIGASMTRRPEDLTEADAQGMAGFVYLPQLTEESARELFGGVRPPAASFSPLSRDLVAPLGRAASG